MKNVLVNYCYIHESPRDVGEKFGDRENSLGTFKKNSSSFNFKDKIL